MQAKKRGSWVEADENLAAWEGGEERMEGKLVQKSSHLSGSGGEGWSEPPSLLLAAIIRPFLPTPRTCNPTALTGHNNQEIKI